MSRVWLLRHARSRIVVLAVEQVDPRKSSRASVAHMGMALIMGSRGSFDVRRVKVSVEFVL